MERATLTVVEDAEDVVRWPLRGHALDLLPGEHNVIGGGLDARVRLERGTISQRVDVRVRDDAWALRAAGPGVHVRDGSGERELAVGEDAPLVDGAIVRIGGVRVRFDVVRERALARVQRRGDVLLLDCGGALAPGRWPALVRVDDLRGVARRTVVTGAEVGAGGEDLDRALADEGRDRERHLAALGDLMPSLHASSSLAGFASRVFDDTSGVPLVLVSSVGRGLAPAHALRLASRVARWLVETRAPLALGTDSFVLTWDGDVRVQPPLAPRPSDTDGRGLLVELFVALFPEHGAWFQEHDLASFAARDVWRRLVDPYLGAFGGRPAQDDDLVTAADAADALELAAWGAARAGSPDVTTEQGPVREELAAIVRGLFPDAWRREQELREELALLDAHAIEGLWRG